MEKYMKTIKRAFLSLCIPSLLLFSSLAIAQIVTLFSHGVADKWKQVRQYVKSYSENDIIYYNDRYLIHTDYIAFNYADATNKFYRVNYNELSFGQDNEMARLYNAYKKTIEKFIDCYVILKGLSRGASNLLIFAGRYVLGNIKAMVLESPYFMMDDVITNMMKRWGIEWLPLSYGQTLAELTFKKYTRHGYSPANCLENIPKDLPILLICSKEDHLVPYTSTISIYKKLVESGHTHVYIFVAKQGKHAAILQGPEGEKYQHIVNAFYKKYNLPHCPASAIKGEPLLVLCQPKIK